MRAIIQPGAARSKTVILVKNLPAATSTNDITDLFVHFGTLGRVLLPPSGVTAIVEFLQPTEARTAFRALAYSKVCIVITVCVVITSCVVITACFVIVISTVLK